ncbi:hypothetical protein CDAR_320721 [Caerostris darwini]|uniref:Uncharacterized protein n=1 Tax=Caerostris darwini TaxID=1538125 RepID=A0AAV4WWZ4_9ARAC|nr:hypothetical protein CDAR_320721 [Caerostris darwini]
MAATLTQHLSIISKSLYAGCPMSHRQGTFERSTDTARKRRGFACLNAAPPWRWLQEAVGGVQTGSRFSTLPSLSPAMEQLRRAQRSCALTTYSRGKREEWPVSFRSNFGRPDPKLWLLLNSMSLE